MAPKISWRTPFTNLWGGRRSEAQAIDEQIEAEIQGLVKGRGETITFSREDNVGFCDFIFDKNPIHRDPQTALAYKFMKLKDTPLVGPLLVGTAERIAQQTYDSIRKYWDVESDEITVVGTQTQFKSPAYPDRPIIFEVEGCVETAGGVDLTISLESDKQSVALVDVSFARGFRQAPIIGGPVHSELYLINEEVIGGINRVLRRESQAPIPFMGAALAPSTMLYLLESRTGSMTGGNLKMAASYLAIPQAGEIQVDVFPSRRKAPSNRFNLRSLVTQETTPIAYTEIFCVTPEPVSFSRTPRVYTPNQPSNQP